MNLKQTVDRIRGKKPLILNLTNTVVQNWTANVLLALDASPVMSNDREDALALTALADALNINIGTLDDDFLDRARACAEACHSPLILDPVGAGATARRTAAALELLPKALILRGNAGEVSALQGGGGQMKGVDSLSDTDGIDTAWFAQKYPKLTLAASGSVDLIFGGGHMGRIPFGTPLMTKVTGMGCSLSAVTAAFAAVLPDPFEAAFQACAFFALCGETAFQKTPHPGSFAAAFLDALHNPDWAAITAKTESL